MPGFAIVFVLASLLGACADDAPNKVFTSGRTWPGLDSSGVAALPQLLAWPGSAVHVRFSGSASARVVLNGSVAALPADSAWVTEAASTLHAVKWGSARFRFELDGRAAAEEAVSPDQPELIWERSGLDLGGAHALSISLVSEAIFGGAVLQSVTLGAEGRFLDPGPPPHLDPSRRILFLGDSFVVGYGNIAGANCSRSAADEDALLGFAALAARRLQADFQLVAWSGAGAVLHPGEQFFNGTAVPLELVHAGFPTGTEMFGRANALDPGAASYNHSLWEPQIVVLALGTNDFHNSKFVPPVGEWAAQYVRLVRQVAAAYPNAHLVQLVYPRVVQVVLPLEQSLQYMQYLGVAFTALQAEPLPNLHLLQLTDEGVGAPDDWCFFHPDTAAHEALAGQVVAFVQATMPWFAGGGSCTGRAQE